MPNERVYVEGLRELEAALKELPKATGKNTIRRALTTAAQPFVDQAKATAPVRSGALKRSIVMSRVKFSAGDAGKRAFAEELAKGASRKEAGEAAREANAGSSDNATSGIIVIGPGRHPQAIFQEFGTAHNAPQAYMRPTWEENKIPAIEMIREALWSEIKKAADRIAKKDARKV